jgi:hypothetical protein
MRKNFKSTSLALLLLLTTATSTIYPRPGGGQSFSSENTSGTNTSEHSGGYSVSNSDNNENTSDYRNKDSYSDRDDGSFSDHSSNNPDGPNLDGHTVMIIFVLFILLFLGISNFSNSTFFYDGSIAKKLIPYICFAAVGFGIAAIVFHNMGLRHNQEIKLAFYIVSGIVAYWAIQLLFGRKRSVFDISASSSKALKRESVSNIMKQTDFMRETDPNFSMILFREFAHLLYTGFYSNLGKPSIVKLKPFLRIFTPEMMTGSTYSEIVVGELKVVEFCVEKENRLMVKYSANYTECKDQTNEYIRHQIGETWVFRRDKGALSPEPERMQAITCPSCGAAADFSDAGICSYCKNTIIDGQMQWTLADRYIYEQNKFELNGLGYYAEEKGTESATIFSLYLNKEAGNLARNLGYSDEEQKQWWDGYSKEFCNNLVVSYFIQIYHAWSDNKLENIRHLLSDRLFHSFKFWIDNYLSSSLRNKLDQISVIMIEMCKIEQDKFYVALTTRIHASCMDYTIDKDGKIIGGSDNIPRKFTEYWVFIRRLDKNFNKQPEPEKCPSCSAGIEKMGETAICGYCHAKISTGNFSWVLSSIVQDEVYRG